MKSIFKQSNYPQNFVNHYINTFLNKLLMQNNLNFMVPKRESTFVLPYLIKISLYLRTRVRKTIERDLPDKLKVIFRSRCRLNTFFRFQDSFDGKIHS